jgi:hypothetical protein
MADPRVPVSTGRGSQSVRPPGQCYSRRRYARCHQSERFSATLAGIESVG